MSAIITIATPTALHVLADTAVVDGGTNLLIGTVEKVRHRARCAFAFRGRQFLIEPMEQILFTAGTDVDHLRRAAPGWIFANTKQPLAEVRALGLSADFDLIVAGWSAERGRPAAWFMTNNDERHGIPAWEPADLEGVALLPDIPDHHAVMAALPRLGDSIDPHKVGFGLMTRQREAVLAMASPGLAVGGSCRLTTITEAGIAQTTLGAWPDVIGEPIRAAT